MNFHVALAYVSDNVGNILPFYVMSGNSGYNVNASALFCPTALRVLAASTNTCSTSGGTITYKSVTGDPYNFTQTVFISDYGV